MKLFLLKMWYSISARMLLLFLLVGGCGFVLFLTLYRFYLSSQNSSTPLPVPFLTYISEQIAKPINEWHMNELMAQTIYSLRIEQQQRSWQTHPSIPAFSQLTLVQSLTANDGYYLSQSGSRYLVLERPQRRFIFGHRLANADEQGYRLMMLLLPLLALLLLLLGYFIAGRFFIPIGWIKKGAMRIGEGDLSYRIPYKRNDELGQLVGIVNQMAEDLERIFDSKRQLLLAISHELRSPLTRMKLNVALLDRSNLSARLEHDIDDMRAIVEGLLYSERLLGPHKAIDKVEISPSVLVQQVVDEYEQHFNIELQFDDNLQTMALDVNKIKFLLRNLVNNAIRYTEPEPRKINIVVTVAGKCLHIRISDNGCGIEPQHQAQVFSAFYRADKSRGRQTGGVGLGLYLCLLIAKAHKGDILLHSQLSEGCCFTVVLPLD